MGINIDNNRDVEILFNTEIGIGYGYIYEVEGMYVSLVYQDRLNQELIKAHKTHAEITEEITNSKAFISKHDNIIDAVNNALNFYFIPELSTLPKVKEVFNLHEAIDQLHNSCGYLIFQMENENVLEEVSEISI